MDVTDFLARKCYTDTAANYKSDYLGEISGEKKLRKFGHMSKLGVPYVPYSLPTQKVWTFWN